MRTPRFWARVTNEEMKKIRHLAVEEGKTSTDMMGILTMMGYELYMEQNQQIRDDIELWVHERERVNEKK